MLLNDEQYAAVLSVSGPIVVCAGAGSGKTRVIAYRVLHLVNTGCPPSHITCVTFTNKAAREMKERISELLTEFETLPLVTTFHGYALRLVRTYGHKLGITHYTILSEDDQEIIIKNVMKHFDIKDKQCTAKKILGHINYIKNNFLTYQSYPNDIEQGLFKALFDKYEEEKKKSCVLDFDDLIITALKLLQDNEIVASIRGNTEHLMVDEYQDTNPIQHELVKLITLDKEKNFVLSSLLVVGDEDQSIYSWRGANVQNILHFQKDFPDAIFLKLTRNYRSTNTILSLANSIIAKNNDRNKKDLWTDKNNHFPVYLIELQSGYQEAELVIKIIKNLKSQQSLGTCAILYRSHYQSRIFEELCITYNVKYKVFGGLNFYQRQEIKDILSYLCLAINQYDKQAFLRCCNTPSRGFGDISQADFIQFWASENMTIFQAIDQYILIKKITEKNKATLLEIKEILQKITDFDKPAEAISYIIQRINYYGYIEKNAENEIEIIARKENIQELITASKTFVQEFNANSTDFIDHLALMYEKSEKSEKSEESEEKEETEDKTILLMSIHAAKGLEFSTVFIVGCEEGIFPSNRSAINNEALEEERRLLYVAVTRAKERLICSYTLSRALWGTIRLQVPSIFTYDFDLRYTKKLTTKNTNITQIEKTICGESIYQERKTLSQQQKETSRQQSNNTLFHPIFGYGEIIEKDAQYITIKFKNGIKKILSTYFPEIQ